MSDNWIVQNLNSALSTWSEKMAELWTLLTENPATFKGGGIWRIMTNINDALTAIAYGLLVLFFAAGIIKTCGSFTDLKKPEHVLKEMCIRDSYYKALLIISEYVETELSPPPKENKKTKKKNQPER